MGFLFCVGRFFCVWRVNKGTRDFFESFKNKIHKYQSNAKQNSYSTDKEHRAPNVNGSNIVKCHDEGSFYTK